MGAGQRRAQFLARGFHRRYKAALTGAASVTESEYVAHFDEQNFNPSDGIGLSEAAPTFQLPDQWGVLRDRDEMMGPNGLLIVFARSSWMCGYCRNQLVEIQLSLDAVRAQQVNVIAITPDSIERHAAFSERYGITYPLLSDVGGHVVDLFGIRNENLAELSALWNAPHPGHYLLDSDGVVVEKSFTGDLRFRASATTLVFNHHGSSGGPAVKVSSPELEAAVYLSTDRVFGGQELAFRIDFQVADGWHVYGSPVPEQYQALSITFEDPDGILDAQSFELPESSLLRFDALDEEVAVHAGAFSATGLLMLRWSAVAGVGEIHGLEHLDAARIPEGTHELIGTIEYQACSDTTCLQPARMTFPLRLEVEADRRRLDNSQGPKDVSGSWID